MTRRASIERLGQDGGPPDGQGAAELVPRPAPKQPFSAGHGHGGQKLPVRQLWLSLGLTADADVLLDPVVVGDQVGVGEGPVVAVSVVAGRLQVQVAEPIALAPPDHAPASDDAEPLPGERLVLRRSVRILQIVDEPVVVVLGAGVAGLLDGARPRQFRRVVPVLQLVGGHVFGEFPGRDLAAGLQQDHFQAGLREDLGSPASGGARPHHGYVVERAVGILDQGRAHL